MASGDSLRGVELPPDMGQAALPVYVEATGHRPRGLFLDYWRANGAAVYGNPISEPFAAANGHYSQAFERGIFQYRPEFLHTADPIARLLPLGRIALQDWLQNRGDDDWRATKLDDHHALEWDILLPTRDEVASIVDVGGGFDDQRMVVRAGHV